jgi:hypothetical protein
MRLKLLLLSRFKADKDEEQCDDDTDSYDIENVPDIFEESL